MYFPLLTNKRLIYVITIASEIWKKKTEQTFYMVDFETSTVFVVSITFGTVGEVD